MYQGEVHNCPAYQGEAHNCPALLLQPNTLRYCPALVLQPNKLRSIFGNERRAWVLAVSKLMHEPAYLPFDV